MPEHEVEGPFAGRDCPCGSEEPGPHNLYCDDCIDSMAREMVEDGGCNA